MKILRQLIDMGQPVLFLIFSIRKFLLLGSKMTIVEFHCKADDAQNALQQEWGNFPFAYWNGIFKDFRYSLYNW